ncbi:MAG: hypothetical protein ACKO2Z_13805, partial [Sphaerospermopsis kisseleviana]
MTAPLIPTTVPMNPNRGIAQTKMRATETSYSVARILVWAIPLLGFIGTVVGISGAVNGFS